MEPYWNYSRIKQVIARAVRNNSHTDLPEEERVVQPIIYISKVEGIETVDNHLYSVSMRKEHIIDQILDLLKGVSINCIH
jgi:hypothetical protein